MAQTRGKVISQALSVSWLRWSQPEALAPACQAQKGGAPAGWGSDLGPGRAGAHIPAPRALAGAPQSCGHACWPGRLGTGAGTVGGGGGWVWGRAGSVAVSRGHSPQSPFPSRLLHGSQMPGVGQLNISSFCFLDGSPRHLQGDLQTPWPGARRVPDPAPALSGLQPLLRAAATDAELARLVRSRRLVWAPSRSLPSPPGKLLLSFGTQPSDTFSRKPSLTTLAPFRILIWTP